jgi:taurine dioxygenase
MELAWETLDKDIKSIIENKNALHTSNGSSFFVEDFSEMESNGNIGEKYSNKHPIVRTHPETGNKILYVNPTYTKKIIGLPTKESDELLERIFRHQEKLDLSCRFKWTENAVAILDNRCTQHYAIADFYPGRGLGHERIMDRIAIVGDQPF